MGEIEISGSDAWSLIQKVITNDMKRLTNGATLYTLMYYEHC